MKFISYNLLKHRAYSEIEGLAKKFTPDAVCLQEVNVTQLPKRIENLELAAGTEKNRLGLAVYIDTDKYEIQEAAAFKLRDAVYDKVAAPTHERLLGVRAIRKDGGESVVLGSFHASPLTALNAVRRTQVKEGLDKLRSLDSEASVLMLGDFNYPVFRKRLQREIEELGFSLFESDTNTYKTKLARGFFDFGAALKLDLKHIATLKQGASDHLPVFLRTEFT